TKVTRIPPVPLPPTSRRHRASVGPGRQRARSRPDVVSRAPVPRLTKPPSCGKEFWETTRNGSVRLAPDCVVTVTLTTEPRWAPTRRMVVWPRPIWSSALGERPSTVEKRSGPRRDVPTTVPTITLFTERYPAPTPSVMAVTAVLFSRFLSSVGFGVPKLICSGSPHKRGVPVRWVKLAPKTPVPHRAITASTIPRRAEPRGTVDPPDLRSRALRTPITAVGAAP